MWLAVVIASAAILLVWHAKGGGGFTPSDIPPPEAVEGIVSTVLLAEKDIAILRAIATKLTQAGYGAQAARVMKKANSLEAQALGVSEVQLAMQHSSMFYPGST